MSARYLPAPRRNFKAENRLAGLEVDLLFSLVIRCF
jgi:hypothetical protein